MKKYVLIGVLLVLTAFLFLDLGEITRSVRVYELFVRDAKAIGLAFKSYHMTGGDRSGLYIAASTGKWFHISDAEATEEVLDKEVNFEITEGSAFARVHPSQVLTSESAANWADAESELITNPVTEETDITVEASLLGETREVTVTLHPWFDFGEDGAGFGEEVEVTSGSFEEHDRFVAYKVISTQAGTDIPEGDTICIKCPEYNDERFPWGYSFNFNLSITVDEGNKIFLTRTSGEGCGPCEEGRIKYKISDDFDVD